MRVTINSPEIARHTGYGRAAAELTEALQRAGVDVCDNAPTIVNFCMPKDYIFRDYTVGYTPWESTELPKGWVEKMHMVDQLWTTSTWTGKVFYTVTGIMPFVLHHGVNDTWQPIKHDKNRPFKFLHVGEPALRKGGEIVLEAWYKMFRKADARLIYKTTGWPMARVKNRGGSIIYSPTHLCDENGAIINSIYTDQQMHDLYCKVDCLVYPTRGEGFGFIPLEAMASGLPTILPRGGGTGDFSHYGVALENYMWHSSDELEHPGLWMDHDVDEVIVLMLDIVEHYDAYAENAYENAFLLREEFDWDAIAQKFIHRLADHL